MAYKIYIALIDNPKIWRAMIIPEHYTFSDLHMSIQCVMGWSNNHLYEFKYNNSNEIRITVPDYYYEENQRTFDSRKIRLSEVFSETISYAKYIYDFGDYWDHWLKIIEIPNGIESEQLPIYCSGNGISPPENTGGIDWNLVEGVPVKRSKSYIGERKGAIHPSCNISLTDFENDKILSWKLCYRSIILDPKEGCLWIRRLIQGDIPIDEVVNDLCFTIPVQDIKDLYEVVISNHLKVRNKATVILAYGKGINISLISEYIFIPKTTIYDVIDQYRAKGVRQAIFNKKRGFKHDKKEYIEKVFSILHAPPSLYGFNRTSWRQEDIVGVMAKEGMSISKGVLHTIIKKSGYSYKKARTVLTSNDPEYGEKLKNITAILSKLSSDEKFFSIDEYGPFSVKLKGGRSLVPQGVNKSVPQWQKSKGSIILTAALELSTNQVTHFYSSKKNTKEMIKLLYRLLELYANEKIIYFSWDAASWHASKELYEVVEHINSEEYRNNNKTPMVELAPLPTCAQFLNVIESIFSGMARAIIHNSNYKSVDDCKNAIDRYFMERNERFKNEPKRAGKKIWGEERVNAEFSESNNCKDPRYR